MESGGAPRSTLFRELEGRLGERGRHKDGVVSVVLEGGVSCSGPRSTFEHNYDLLFKCFTQFLNFNPTITKEIQGHRSRRLAPSLATSPAHRPNPSHLCHSDY